METVPYINEMFHWESVFSTNVNGYHSVARPLRTVPTYYQKRYLVRNNFDSFQKSISSLVEEQNFRESNLNEEDID